MKKITLKEKILIAVAFVFIAVILFNNFFYGPVKADIKSLNEEITEKEALLTTLSAQGKGLTAVEKELKATESEYEKAVSQFPAKWDDREMLTFIEKTIGDKLTKKSLVFNSLQNLGTYYMGSFTISVSGTYSDFFTMLWKFENSEYFNTISYINVPAYNKEDTDAVYNFQFTINFYALSE